MSHGCNTQDFKFKYLKKLIYDMSLYSCDYIHVMDKDHNPVSYIRFGSYNFFSEVEFCARHNNNTVSLNFLKRIRVGMVICIAGRMG
jgi:hypothetical protein